jgi:hypothetical protein
MLPKDRGITLPEPQSATSKMVSYGSCLHIVSFIRCLLLFAIMGVADSPNVQRLSPCFQCHRITGSSLAHSGQKLLHGITTGHDDAIALCDSASAWLAGLCLGSGAVFIDLQDYDRSGKLWSNPDLYQRSSCGTSSYYQSSYSTAA